MQVSVESTGSIGRKLSIVVPAERIDAEVDKRLKSLRGRVKIDGFRPGKVPMSIVSQQYGDSVYQEVVGEVFQSTFYEAAAQQNLRVAGAPSIEPTQIEAGKDLEYTATFDTYPEFEIADMSKVEVKRPKVSITEDDIDEMIETLRKQQQGWKEVKRASKKGDLMTVDFEGKLNGEPFEGGSSKDYSVEVGAGRMLKDFETALKGMKAGETKEIDVTFPDDYPADNLKGKTAQFTITAKTVSAPELPKIDKNFIQKFGVEDGTKKSFKAEIKKNMQREVDQRIKARLKQSVMDNLHDLHEVDLPASLVKDEVKQVRDEMAQNSQGADLSSLPDKLFEDQAARRVKLGLVVGEIIKHNKMEKDQAKVDAMLDSLAATYEEPQAFIDYYRSNPQAMQTIEAAVMEEMIVDWVMEQAKVKDEKMSFSELMNPPSEQKTGDKKGAAKAKKSTAKKGSAKKTAKKDEQ